MGGRGEDGERDAGGEWTYVRERERRDVNRAISPMSSRPPRVPRACERDEIMASRATVGDRGSEEGLPLFGRILKLVAEIAELFDLLCRRHRKYPQLRAWPPHHALPTVSCWVPLQSGVWDVSMAKSL